MDTQENLEITLFDEAMGKVQWYLKLIGFQVNDRFRDKSFWKRFNLWSLTTISWILLTEVGQITWLINNASSGKSFVQHTNIATCLILCLLSNIQTYYFYKYSRQVYQLIEDVRAVQSRHPGNPINESDVKFMKSKIKVLKLAVHGVAIFVASGAVSFGTRPLVSIAKDYYNTGEVNLILPFLLAFPFDTNDIKFWIPAYIFEMWSAIVAPLAVITPGFVCYACSTFIIIQFRILCNDLENLIPVGNNLSIQIMDEDIKIKLRNIIQRHKKLIACVDLMEFVYSESTLFKVFTSTLLICLTGFNVTTMPDLTLVVPFIQFLMLSLNQIYFLCYYGDMIMVYSTQVADAAYGSQWYRAEKSIVKYLMMISSRAWKPSKMTALGFSDLSLNTFMRILSSSWSYFALLSSVYRE